MTDEQIARLPQVLDRMNRLHIMKHPVQDYYDLDAAAREYLRLLPYIKAVCEANKGFETQVGLMQLLVSTGEGTGGATLESAFSSHFCESVTALVSAVKEGE